LHPLDLSSLRTCMAAAGGPESDLDRDLHPFFQ